MVALLTVVMASKEELSPPEGIDTCMDNIALSKRRDLLCRTIVTQVLK